MVCIMSSLSLQGEDTEVTKSLRACKVCGLEARTDEDLELFKKDKESLYGRKNLCKKDDNVRLRKRYREDHLEYVYSNMIRRCYNPNLKVFPYYGGRGITVCEEWRNDRQAFIDWAKQSGFKPELQIDRIDNNGPYSPENCRWVTPSQQHLNRSDTVTFPEKGTRICHKCKTEKPFSEFHHRTTDTHGHKRLCKDCQKEHNKEYRERKKRGKKP